MGDPHLDVFACFLRDERRPIQGGLLGRLWWRLAVRRAAVGDAALVVGVSAATCWNGGSPCQHGRLWGGLR